MPTLRIYTCTQIDDKVIEQEVEITDITTHKEKMKIIRAVLGLEDEE